jgi:hypothetical protein
MKLRVLLDQFSLITNSVKNPKKKESFTRL